MIRLGAVWVILLSCSAWAQIEVVSLEKETVRPGDIVRVELRALPELARLPSPKDLSTKPLSNELFFMGVGSWSAGTLRAKAVIGKKFSPDQELTASFNGESVKFSFKNWIFDPKYQAPEKPLSYQDVPWYRTPWWRKRSEMVGGASVIVIAAAIFLGHRWYQRQRERRLAREARARWTKQLEDGQGMRDFSQVWLSRDEVERAFPDQFFYWREFFDVLNQYHFNPHASEPALARVKKAREKLLNDLKGGARGA